MANSPSVKSGCAQTPQRRGQDRCRADGGLTVFNQSRAAWLVLTVLSHCRLDRFVKLHLPARHPSLEPPLPGRTAAGPGGSIGPTPAIPLSPCGCFRSLGRPRRRGARSWCNRLSAEHDAESLTVALEPPPVRRGSSDNHGHATGWRPQELQRLFPGPDERMAASSSAKRTE